MKRILLTVALAATLAACGGPDGNPYVDEANQVCQPRGGITHYTYGDNYDVAICKDGTAHALTGSENDH